KPPICVYTLKNKEKKVEKSDLYQPWALFMKVIFHSFMNQQKTIKSAFAAYLLTPHSSMIHPTLTNILSHLKRTFVNFFRPAAIYYSFPEYLKCTRTGRS